MMKLYDRNIVVDILLIGIIAAFVGLWYQSQQREKALQQQLSDMQVQVTQLEEKIGKLQQEVGELDKASVKGIVRDANNAILIGWEALLDTVEKGLESAREALEQDALGTGEQSAEKDLEYHSPPQPQQGPEIQQPEAQQPEAQQPEAQQPEVQQSKVQQPEVQQPEVQQSEVRHQPQTNPNKN